MKRIAILGSTGSIGMSTLKVVRHLKEEFQITALAAHSKIEELYEQALEFHPKLIAVYDKEKARELQKRLPHMTVLGGAEGLEAVATEPSAHLVVSAIVGTAGLLPTVAAIKAGKEIGLANKEVLVAAGQVVMEMAKKYRVPILPIDSEHSALFQCLKGEDPTRVNRLILTASGGPFRLFDEERLSKVTPEDALKHPKWNMGAKITIDCSTLMNKGLEAIESHWLFGVSVDRIEVVIHPQSIIHSFVEFIDGSMLAQMNQPDMIVPIQYAISYPKRLGGLLKPFDFTKCTELNFASPDRVKFPCLELAYEAMRRGGSLPCYMNAVNEVLVERFLKKEIAWTSIAKKLADLMSRHQVIEELDLERILEVDQLAREQARKV